VTALCAGFEQYLVTIATLEWAGEFIRGLDRHERILRELTEQVAPGWYAGECGRVTGKDTGGDDVRCEMPMHVVPGLTWVTCDACGRSIYARDRVDVILSEAVGWVARPKLMAETLVALIDTEQSVDRLYDRIRKWESLGWLVAVRRYDSDGDPVGPKRYRLGEVLDLVLGKADAPTRPSRMTAV
jgi:hypothetical protein